MNNIIIFEGGNFFSQTRIIIDNDNLHLESGMTKTKKKIGIISILYFLTLSSKYRYWIIITNK